MMTTQEYCGKCGAKYEPNEHTSETNTPPMRIKIPRPPSVTQKPNPTVAPNPKTDKRQTDKTEQVADTARSLNFVKPWRAWSLWLWSLITSVIGAIGNRIVGVSSSEWDSDNPLALAIVIGVGVVGVVIFVRMAIYPMLKTLRNVCLNVEQLEIATFGNVQGWSVKIPVVVQAVLYPIVWVVTLTTVSNIWLFISARRLRERLLRLADHYQVEVYDVTGLGIAVFGSSLFAIFFFVFYITFGPHMRLYRTAKTHNDLLDKLAELRTNDAPKIRA
jgi:hypothetical protein